MMIVENKELLLSYIEKYKQDFSKNWNKEKYKWEAIKTFQDNWDINAENFAEMLKISLSKAGNLLNRGSKGMPAKMIIQFAEKYPEKVGEMFVELFNEKKTIVERIKTFQDKSDNLLNSYKKEFDPNNSKLKSHYQKNDAISTYMWLMYPDKYYCYRYEKYKNTVFCLTKIDNVKMDCVDECFEFYDEICEVFQSDVQLKELLKNSLDEDCYPDPYLKTLVIDFTHYLSSYVDEEKQISQNNDKRYWIYSPGENACKWEEFYKEGIIALGYTVGSLSQYNEKAELDKNLEKEYGTNELLALWEFSHILKEGDVVFVKKGRFKIIGRGVIEGGYYYDEKRSDFKHCHKINWTHKGEWEHPDGEAVRKTLTDISTCKYPGYAEKIDSLFISNELEDLNQCQQSEQKNMVSEKEEETDCQYFWLNCSPKIWNIANMSIGEEQHYSFKGTHNNLRKNFNNAKVGDKLVGYVSTPIKKVVSLAEVSRIEPGENLHFKKTKHLENPISYSELKEYKELENMEYFHSPQGSLFKLTQDEYNFIIKKIEEANDLDQETDDVVFEDQEQYTNEDFLEEVFMDLNQFTDLKNTLLDKKNIILQGAPGVGKTFSAKRLAYALMGKKDDTKIKFIQFHQNYSYEEFIYGYKPTDNGSFKPEKGCFYKFCEEIKNYSKDTKCFFIIDEINRGNMSKIFGELLMAIEKDYRGKPIPLSLDDSMQLVVPENLYIIGMMNTADRSLAMIDYALRRRFSFVEMKPAFECKQFKDYVNSSENKGLFNTLIERVKRLNDIIANDESLGEGFCIGHSYFVLYENGELAPNLMTDEKIKSIVKYDIFPMIDEYWFDDKEQKSKAKDLFKDII